MSFTLSNKVSSNFLMSKYLISVKRLLSENHQLFQGHSKTIIKKRLPVQSEQWEHQENLWNMLKVNNKDTEPHHCRRSVVVIVNFKYFSYFFSSVSIVDFQRANISCRSSHQRRSIKKCVLKSFAKFTGKHLYQSLLFLIKLHSEVCNFVKKDTLAQVFSYKFCEI